MASVLGPGTTGTNFLKLSLNFLCQTDINIRVRIVGMRTIFNQEKVGVGDSRAPGCTLTQVPGENFDSPQCV